jgi:predicted ATPase
VAILLREVRLRDPAVRGDGHPFSAPVVGALAAAPLVFDRAVTFLVGENGSGKSTLLEAVACAADLPDAGGAPLASDPSLAAARALGRALRLSWSARTRRGSFVRAEDVFGFAKRMDATRADLEAERRAVADDPALSPRARGFGQLAYAREIAALRDRYGDGLDARSHGEAFLTLFESRFAPRGLYLLDEPEAPLSPLRQLALLALLRRMADPGAGDAQFVVATHSPILTALPDARILSLDGGTIRPIAWDDLDHVRITRQFLNDPEGFLRHL